MRFVGEYEPPGRSPVRPDDDECVGCLTAADRCFRVAPVFPDTTGIVNTAYGAEPGSPASNPGSLSVDARECLHPRRRTNATWRAQ